MRASWWWIDRWRKSTAYTDLTLAERGAYRELLDECWLRGGVIPADDRILARIAGASPEEWKAVMVAVLARFEPCEGGLRNVTADEVMGQHQAFRDRQIKKGQARAKKAGRSAAGTFTSSPSPASQPAETPAEVQPADQPSVQPENQPSVHRTPYTENKRKKEQTTSTSPNGAREVFDYWVKTTKRHAPKWSPERKRILEIRLAEESGTDEERVAALKLAVDGALLDPWYNGSETGKTFLGFENIFKHEGRDRIEKLQEVARKAKPPPPKPSPEALPAEDNDAREKWEAVKLHMKTLMPPHLYRTWFSPTFGWGWEDEARLVVTVPGDVHKRTLQEQYGAEIRRALARVGVKSLRLAVKEFE